MTDSDQSDQTTFVKTDAAGRMRFTQKQRLDLLSAFDQGSLSGPDFARVHGINYQTFAGWRQRRRKGAALKGARVDDTTDPKAVSSFTLIEATLDTPDGEPAQSQQPLILELSGGARLIISDQSQMTLATTFLNLWQTNQPC